jgi:enamine deaminase RidA (YjgF/YER057c/UK114 family)
VTGRGKDVVSGRAPEPVGAFPHAKRVGDFLFLSGIGPRKRGTKEIPADFESQVLAVFENVRLVLEDAGARWDDIVDVTVFLTDMKADFPHSTGSTRSTSRRTARRARRSKSARCRRRSPSSSR